MSETEDRALDLMFRNRVIARASADLVMRIIQKAQTVRQVGMLSPVIASKPVVDGKRRSSLSTKKTR